MPHANSTTSWPRVTSPSASESTLPCSAVMSSAISPLRASSSSRNLNSTWVRLVSDAWRHSPKAACAAATASSTSAVSAKSTVPDTWPVAGSKMSPCRSATPPKALPSIQWVTCLLMGRCLSRRWVGDRRDAPGSNEHSADH